jgi:solute carrier family 39 (zinc transporter), member 1/2/3
MIHSLVIGLTLSTTSGKDFSEFCPPLHLFQSTFLSPSVHPLTMLTHIIFTASLLTALLFHQLFEGLSLGVRIASLPPLHPPSLPSSSRSSSPQENKWNWRGSIQVILCLLFAVATPIGIAVGLGVLPKSSAFGEGDSDVVEGVVRLSKGVMVRLFSSPI